MLVFHDEQMMIYRARIPADLSFMLMLPVGVALAGFATSSSSLLDSSLLELSVLVFAFLADGPFVASALFGDAFRFLASALGNKHRDKLRTNSECFYFHPTQVSPLVYYNVLF